MTAPTTRDAARRAPVELADGRLAHLIFVPSRASNRRGSPGRRRSPGSKARVVLDTGEYLSVSLDDIHLLD